MTKSDNKPSASSAAHANPNTKVALLEAAQDLFSRRGYAAVSTRDVAEAANVNLGSIQYYFGSKGKLFIETIRHMMEGGCQEMNAHFAMQDCGSCVHTASLRLAQFVKSFLHYLLVPDGPQPCRMMFREIFSETSEDPEMFDALVSTMADEFARPLETMLGKVIAHIKPHATPATIAAFTRSIVGQCSFYVTHRPFQERLMGVKLSETKVIDQLAQHIISFSLAGLGMTDQMIADVLKESF